MNDSEFDGMCLILMRVEAFNSVETSFACGFKGQFSDKRFVSDVIKTEFLRYLVVLSYLLVFGLNVQELGELVLA